MSVPETERRGADAIAAEVCNAIAETLEIPVESVQREQELEADLGVDSLAMIQIGVTLEEAVGFRAPDLAAADALAIETVGDLVELVVAQVQVRR